MDVTVRVAPIRGFAVESLLGLLLDQVVEDVAVEDVCDC
jgi:hypothetical protein